MLRLRAYVGEGRGTDEQRRVHGEGLVAPGRGEALARDEMDGDLDAGRAADSARPGAGGDDDARGRHAASGVTGAAHPPALHLDLHVGAIEDDLQLPCAAREGLDQRV